MQQMNTTVQTVGSNLTKNLTAPLTGVSAPAQQAARSMQQFGAISVASTAKAGDALNQFGTRVQQTGKATQGFTASAKQLGGAVQSSSLAFGVAAASAYSLFQSYDNLVDAQNQVHKSATAVDRATKTLSVAQEDLAKKQANSATSALDLQQAHQAVEIAQQRLADATERNTILVGNQNEAWSNFAAQVVPSIAMLGGAAAQMFSTFSQNSAALKSGLTGLVGAFKGLVTGFQGVGAASAAAGVGTKTLAAGISPLAVGLGTVSASSATAAGGTTLLGGAAGAATPKVAGLSGAVYSLLGPLTAIVGIIAGGITAFEALSRNAGGSMDALNGLRTSIDSVIGVTPEARDGMNAFEQSVTDSTSSALDSIPGYKSFMDSIFGVADATETTATVEERYQESLVQTKQVQDDAAESARQLFIARGIGDKVGQVSRNVSLGVADALNKEAAASDQAAQKMASTIVTVYKHRDAANGLQQALSDIASKGLTNVFLGLSQADLAAAGFTETTKESTKATAELGTAAEFTGQQITKMGLAHKALAGASTDILLMASATANLTEAMIGSATAADLTAARQSGWVEGMVTARDAVAVETKELVANAEALGFEGDARNASLGVLAQFVSRRGEEISVNKEAAETYFKLDEAQQAQLGTLGITDELMGEVEVGANKLNATQLQAVTTFGAAAEATAKAAEELEKYKASFDKFSPSVLAAAKAWGIYYDAQLANTDVGRTINKQLSELQANTDKAREGTIDLATANGVDLNTAMHMSNDALASWLINAGELGPTAAQAAADTAAAAKAMSDAWKKSFEDIKTATAEASGVLRTAGESIWKEMGDNIKVGLNDVKMDIMGGPGFGQDFWEKIFPAQIASNVFEKSFDKDELVDDLQDLKERVVEKGMITEEDAKAMFDPLVNYIQNTLPDDSKEAIGELVGVFPGLMKLLKPSIVNGLIEVGAAAKEAVGTNIVDPMVEALKTIPEGASGIGIGDKLIGIIRAGLPAVKGVSEEYALAIQGILDSTLPMYNTTEEKIQAVTEILGQLGVGFDDLLTGVDEDADGIADIMDTKILTPAKEAALEMAKMWRDVYMFDPTKTALVKGLDAYIAKTEAASVATTNAKPPVDNLGQSLEDAANPKTVEFFNNTWGAIDKIGTSADTAAGKVSKLVQAALDARAAFREAAPDISRLSQEPTTPTGSRADALRQQQEMRGGATTTKPAPAPTTKPAAAPAAQTPAVIPAPNFQAADSAWAGYIARVNTNLATINTNIQTGFATIASTISTALGTALGGAVVAWGGHVTAVQTQLAALNTAIVTAFATISTTLMTSLGTSLGQMVVAWGGHVLAVQTQLALLSTAVTTGFQTLFLDAMTQLGTALGQMVVAWNGHILGVGTAITTLGTALQAAFALIFTTLISQVGTGLGQMVIAWNGHVTAVAGQVAAIGSAITTGLQTAFTTTISQLGTFLGNMVIAWNGHIQAVSNAVNAVGGQLNRLAQGYNLLAAVVQGFQKSGTQSMNAFKAAATSMASSATASVQRLANNVANAMSRIVSSMNTAAKAAKNLQSSINSLKNKDITVTTHYKTVGKPGGGIKSTAHGTDEIVKGPKLFLTGEAGPEHVRVTPLAHKTVSAANGFSGVVNQPTRFFTGEGNRPEHVQITPLAGNSNAYTTHGTAAATSVRAGRHTKKSVDHTVYYEDGSKITYYSDGSQKKGHYKIKKGERWEAAAARESGEPVGRDLVGRGDYVTPSGERYKSEEMYDFTQKKEAELIKRSEEKENKTGKKETPTRTYTYVNKKGKVKKKEVKINEGTGARPWKKGRIETRVDTSALYATGSFGVNRGTYDVEEGMGRLKAPPGRFGMGGIWEHAAFGGKGDMFPYPIPEGFKKTLSKTYYPDGSVWNNYSDGSREMIRPGKTKKKKKKAAHGFTGLVTSPTEFTVGEGGKPEMINIEPLTGGKSTGGGPGNSRSITIQLVQDQPIIVDGRQIARIVRDYELRGYSAIT